MLNLRLTVGLCGFYFFYFGILGMWLPYWGLYLQSLQFVPARIGELMAIPQITRLVAPTLWGWLADRLGKRMPIIRLACGISAISFAGVYLAGDTYGALVAVTVLFSFFWNAALPQFEAVTLNHLGEHAHYYSRIRLWGSIGFIVAVTSVGFWVCGGAIALVPFLILGMFIALWSNSLFVPEANKPSVTEPAPPLGEVLRKPTVIVFFVICFLNQTGHGPYYSFFSMYLERYGYAREVIGLFWALSVGAEVLLFIWFPSFFQRIGARRLMQAALGLAALRWLLIAHCAESAPLLFFAQTLHAFSFGVFHVVTVHLVHEFFPGTLQGRGQALLSSLSYGIGNALGALMAGYLWTWIGPVTMFDLAALLAACGWYLTRTRLTV